MVSENSIPLSNILFPNLVFLLVYIFIIWEKFPKVVVALAGASLIIFSGTLSQSEAFSYVDWNVIFLLVGMMIVVSILGQTGVFDWLALHSTKYAKGSGVKLLVALSVLTAVLSAFLDNVTTVLFMASITCSLANRLKINAVPFLLAEVIASNIGGTATLIGDPPNIMIGSAAKLSFIDFIMNLTPLILIIVPVTLIILYVYFKNQLILPEYAIKELEIIDFKDVIKDKPLLIKSLIILSLILIAFIFHHVLHQEVGTIALGGAAILMMFEDFEDVWNDVEWTTIFFFIGLFIIVGAVEKVGTLSFAADWFLKVTDNNFDISVIFLLWFSGLLSAVVDNIPYTATMIPFIQELKSHYDQINPLWWSLALGACLGGNGSLIGATANVIVVDIARKNGFTITFMDFLKIGSLVTVVSLILSTFYLWGRYLL